MVADVLRARTGSLRQILKERTAPLHDALDSALGEAALDTDGYADFLSRQYGARCAIELWAEAHLEGDMVPPATRWLIAADLAELGHALPVAELFSFPERGDALGLAWALGGSALGNKALLARRRRSGLVGPERFLGNNATATYFGAVLPQLSEAAEEGSADAAVAAAEAVFSTFLAAANRPRLKAVA